jgi:hypothetical protein
MTVDEDNNDKVEYYYISPRGVKHTVTEDFFTTKYNDKNTLMFKKSNVKKSAKKANTKKANSKKSNVKKSNVKKSNAKKSNAKKSKKSY